MPFLGKRKSREKSGYKSNDDPAGKNIKMSPVADFRHELVQANKPAKKGDKFYVAKPHSRKKKVPAGSIGCFKPEGRVGTVDISNERMSKLEKDIRILKKDNSEQKTKIETYEAQLKNLNDKNELLESIYREKTAIEFNNDVVQLVHALLHAKILELAENPKIIKGKLALRHDDVMKLLTPESRRKIENDPVYIKLIEIMKSGFHKVRRRRNENTHPNTINIEMMVKKTKLVIGDDKLGELPNDSRRCFLTAQNIFNRIKKFDNLENLIEIFNRSNKK